jgi:hypothetical protein
MEKFKFLYNKLLQCRLCDQLLHEDISFEEHLKTHDEQWRATKDVWKPSTIIPDGSNFKPYKCYPCNRIFSHHKPFLYHLDFHERHHYRLAEGVGASSTSVDPGTSMPRALSHDIRCPLCEQIVYILKLREHIQMKHSKYLSKYVRT